MTALTARNIALADQILATLADEWPLPMSTAELWRKMRPPCDGWPHTRCWDLHLDYTAVYRALCRLAKSGEVEKASFDGMRSCYWRRWPA